jgi:hypothetical protein
MMKTSLMLRGSTQSSPQTTCVNDFNFLRISPGVMQEDVEHFLVTRGIKMAGDDELFSSTRFFHHDSIINKDTVEFTYYMEFETGLLKSVSIDAVAKNKTVLEKIMNQTIKNCYPNSVQHNEDVLLYENIGGLIHSMSSIIERPSHDYSVLYTISTD